MQVLSRGFLLYELEIFLASCRVGQLDCKTVGFFLKISKEIGKAWRKSLARAQREPHTPLASHSPVSLSFFSLVPDLLFDCSRVLEYAEKYGLFCSLGRSPKCMTLRFLEKIQYRTETRRKRLKVNFRSCVGVVCTNCVYFNRG